MIAVIIYRASRILYGFKVPFIPKLLMFINRIFFSCHLPYKLKVGKNFCAGYNALGIVIHERVIIGDDCHISQNVTIGGTSKKYLVPTLGHSVYVGAGAKIIGEIKIGNNVVIGANAVVVDDIPDNALAVGVPAKVIKININKSDYV